MQQIARTFLRRSCDFVEAIGARPYIKLKKNSAARSHGSRAWRNMILGYGESYEEWSKRYHIRSSAETDFSAIKRKIGQTTSKTLNQPI